MMQWLLLLLALAVSVEATAFVRPIHHRVPCVVIEDRLPAAWMILRGGADVDDDDEESEEEDETINDDDESQVNVEDVEELDASLAASAVKKTVKAQRAEEKKHTSSSKSAVNEKLGGKKKKTSLLKLLHVPYILRACLSPKTLVAMTIAYWKSLFNLDYPKRDVSEELRSALETKAKSSPSSPKGRRKMKRGQAKTLSDLPQLST